MKPGSNHELGADCGSISMRVRSVLAPLLKRVLLLALYLVTSCTHNEGEEIAAEFRRVDVLYRTSDIYVAEKVLLEHPQDLIKKRKKGLQGIDYDTSLAIANGRLFLIYHRLGDSNQAQQCFQQSVDSFNSRRRNHGIQLETFDQKLLTEKVDKWDSLSSVRWKTNAFH